MKYDETNVAQALFNADAPYIYDGRGNYVFSARSLAILFNTIVKAAEPDNKTEQKINVVKVEKPKKCVNNIDWGKVNALKRAGWSNKAIAEEVKAETIEIDRYFVRRKA